MPYKDVGDGAAINEACRALLEHLGIHPPGGDAPSAVAAWNDRPGQTAEIVVREMLACAEKLP